MELDLKYNHFVIEHCVIFSMVRLDVMHVRQMQLKCTSQGVNKVWVKKVLIKIEPFLKSQIYVVKFH